MNRFKGWRTITANAVALLVAFGALTGVVIPESDQAALIAGIVAVVNIVLRFKTDTAVGKAE